MKVSQREYANLRKQRGLPGCRATIKRKIQRGIIELDENGLIEVDQADAAWDANYDPRYERNHSQRQWRTYCQPDTSDGPVPTYEKSLALEKHYQAKLKELEHQLKTKEVILLSEAEDNIFKICRTTRDRLLQIPHKVDARIAAESDRSQCNKILMEAVTESLEEVVKAIKELDV